MNRKSLIRFLILLMSLVVLSAGCTKSEELSLASFDFIYSDPRNLVSLEELRSRDSLDNQEIISTFIDDYLLYAQELDENATTLSEYSKVYGKANAAQYMNASKLFTQLSQELKQEAESLRDFNCPLVWDDSRQSEIEACGKANIRWSSSLDRALECTYYFAALELMNLPEFNMQKMSVLAEYSMKDISSCAIFRDSSSIYGNPKKLGVTWIPSRFQSKFLREDQMFVVEIDEGLYTESTSSGEILDAVYGSWYGSCSVYKRYESRLIEKNLILGSIKAGSCN
jgi:hypothetical protein